MLAKSITRNIVPDCYSNNQFPRVPDKQVPVVPPGAPLQATCNNNNSNNNYTNPLKTKSLQSTPAPVPPMAAAQAPQNKYMTIQALPCTVGVDGCLDTRGHQ